MEEERRAVLHHHPISAFNKKRSQSRGKPGAARAETSSQIRLLTRNAGSVLALRIFTDGKWEDEKMGMLE